MSALGQTETLGRFRRLVRSSPDSGHAGLTAAGPVGANKRHHSITSSARASSIAGISRPSAFAVLRLMTQLEFGRLVKRDISRISTSKNLIDEVGEAAIHVR